MSKDNTDARDLYVTSWPVGGWLFAVFWAAAVLLALAFWSFS